MAMLGNDLQPLNAHGPMEATESGIVMLINAVQLLKALCPMLVTEFGIAMLANELQLQNALRPMVVTESGMVVLQTVAFSTFHAPHQSSSMLIVPSGMLKWI